MNVLIGKDKLFVKQLYIFVFNGKVGVGPVYSTPWSMRWARGDCETVHQPSKLIGQVNYSIAEFWSISIGGNLAQACLNRVSLGELNLNFVMVDMSPSLVLKIRNMKCRLCQSWYAKVVIALNIAWNWCPHESEIFVNLKYPLTENTCWLKIFTELCFERNELYRIHELNLEWAL